MLFLRLNHTRLLAWLLACFIPFAAAGQTGSVVTVNSNNVLVLNGNPVFMIGMSPGPPNNGVTPTGGDALQELGDAGALLFRINQTNNWSSQLIAYQQAALDWAGQHGMYCWVNLRELSEFASTDTNTPASLRAIVDTFKNHPALGLWKNYDEAWWSGVSKQNLQNGYEVIQQEDTNHPVVQTHAPRGTIADLQPYNAAADVLAVDIYPVAVPSPSNPPLTNTNISVVGDWTSVIGQVAAGQKEFWTIEQIAFSGTSPPSHTLVFPTFTQSRYMAYQAIIDGARGLMFYGGNIAATMDSQDATLGWNWTFWTNVLKPVVQQLGDHGPLESALVQPNSTLPITMSGTTVPDIEYCAREAPPYLFILASKREGSATNVTFSGLPAWATNGEVLFESPRMVTATNGQFTDTFAPFDVHVYRFSQTNQSPSIVFQSESLTNVAGTTAGFYVSANGTGPLSYQWRKNKIPLSNGGIVSGATTPNLILSGVSQSDAASYDVVVTGYGSITDAPAALKVLADIPIINSQPRNATNIAGTTASFNVVATGTGTLAYQWLKNGLSLSDGGNVKGSATSSLTVFNVTPADAANYQVTVININGPAVSAMAVLSVVTGYPYFDPFNDPPGAILGQQTNSVGLAWSEVGTGNAGTSVTIAPGNLSTSGLAASTGNSVQFGGSGKSARFSFPSGNVVKSGTIYYSHLFRVADLTGISSDGVFVSGFNNSIGTQANTPSVVATRLYLRASNNGYNIGTAKNTSTTNYWVWDSRVFTTNDTIFLVGAYTFQADGSTNDISELWIDPSPADYGAPAPSSVPLLATNGANISSSQIASFDLLQRSTSEPPSMIVDELRIGLAWESVTPPAALRTFSLIGGMFQFLYTNNSGQNGGVYASTNLIDWVSAGVAVPMSPGVFQFIDTTATNYHFRFYQFRSP